MYKLGGMPSPKTESASTLILDLPASKIVRKRQSFKPPSLWYFVIVAEMIKT